jgi:hypothetical protein
MAVEGRNVVLDDQAFAAFDVLGGVTCCRRKIGSRPARVA